MMQAEIRIRTWPVCSVMGCGRSLFGGRGGKCLDCAETADTYCARLKRYEWARRFALLKTWAWVSAFVVLMSWLAIEAYPPIWFAFKMWGK
jgi:hypothetical protein